jgi:sulfite reductase (NADPH) flavoprotein alpha-component
MNVIPIIPDSAPFTAEQRAWLNGFLAGVFGHPAGAVAAAPNGSASTARRRLLIMFGSQSGNAESLAKKVGKTAGGRGFDVRVTSMDAVVPADLEREENLLVVTSTWGEGDMPDNAQTLWSGLNQNGSSPNLRHLNYSVLALGDRNYGDTFCLAGRRFDERLAELGARRVFERIDCDIDYDIPAERWSNGVLSALGGLADGATKALPTQSAPAAPPVIVTLPEPENAGIHSKRNPFPARLIENRRLNRDGSAKDTRHIAFSLEGRGLDYEAGDALGVFAVNCPDVVARVIEAHRLDAAASVPLPDGGQAPLGEAMLRHFEIRALSGKTPDRQMTASEFVEPLRKLQPRLYSIASSPKAHPGEVHLCVGIVRYERDGLSHKGVASTFLADRLPPGGSANVFVHRSPHFRLPGDGAVPVIMVGPGTGIAPFRAFLEERAATGSNGRNWLFFGDQHAATDFLYKDEIERFLRAGVLHRLDLAFSRDQLRKRYVQHRMLACGIELWRWLEEGACFYICGDASRMAKDVDAALHQIVQVIGGRSADGAAAYLADMKKSKRYLRDVY